MHDDFLSIPLPTVAEEPRVIVANWAILELDVVPLPDIPGPYRFVLGFDVVNHCGRVSTRIQALDVGRRRARTLSGRHYELEGSPSLDVDAWGVWSRSGFARYPHKDVTAEVWPGYVPGEMADYARGTLEAALAGAAVKSKSSKDLS